MKKKVLFLVLVLVTSVYISCKKEVTNSDNLNLLTSHIWTADSLLADGNDASGQNGLLEMFKGDTKFNEDGTGYVGDITGTWKFSNDEETALTITSDSLVIPVTANIAELTAQSLKLTTRFPLPTTPVTTADVRMTFIPK
ncbi:MAG: hypothetical protein GXO80_02135 [Chlorobi bacterium]|nr:hypothetical protein [Chlorobiota bacterium]